MGVCTYVCTLSSRVLDASLYLSFRNVMCFMWAHQPGLITRKEGQYRSFVGYFFFYLPPAVRVLILMARRIRPPVSLVGFRDDFLFAHEVISFYYEGCSVRRKTFPRDSDSLHLAELARDILFLATLFHRLDCNWPCTIERRIAQFSIFFTSAEARL